MKRRVVCAGGLVCEQNMFSDRWPERVAVLSEGENWAIALGEAVTKTFRDNGCEVDMLRRDEEWEKVYDFVLGYGPHTWEGSFLATAERLESYKAKDRPFFYWWYTDAPFRPELPTMLIRPAAKLHVKSSKFFRNHPEAHERLWARKLDHSFVRKHFRLRNLGELYDLRRRRLVDGLAVTATSRADYFNRHGLDPIVAPIGYHPYIQGGDRGTARDIDTVFFGAMHGKRRERLLGRVKRDLDHRGIELDIRCDRFYGEERTRVLNRAKTVLNIMQYPYDIVALRFLFCAANRVLMVSEPVVDKEPFVPGRHFVTAPVDKLAETIEFYIANEAERRQIVEEAYRLVTEEYTIEKMIERIVAHSRKLSASRYERQNAG